MMHGQKNIKFCVTNKHITNSTDNSWQYDVQLFVLMQNNFKFNFI